MPNSFIAQVYDLGDPWAAKEKVRLFFVFCYSGVSHQDDILLDVGVCRACLGKSSGFSACKRTDVKTQQESIWCLRFLRRWTQGWTGGDPQNCSLPNPATGKYGPNCTAWDAAKWSPGMQARRKPAPFSSFWKRMFPIETRDNLPRQARDTNRI